VRQRCIRTCRPLLRGFQCGERITGPLAHRIEHGLDGARQIAGLLAQHILKQLQAVRVHQVLEDHRVVQRQRRELLVHAGAQRQRSELALRCAEELFAVIERRTVAVGRTQARGEAHEEIRKYQRIPPIRGRLAQRFCIIPAREEQHRATMTDEVGERFIEVGMPADVPGVVQQLVDDHVGQRGAVVAQQIGQQRVGEPSKRAERDGRAHVRVVAVTFETRRFRSRLALGKVPLVWNAPNDREPPRIGLQLQLIRRRDDVHDLVRVDVRNAAVAVADAQVERLVGKHTHREDELQFLASCGVKVPASQHLLDRLPPPQDLRLLIAGTQDVAGRAAGEEGAEGQKAKRNERAGRERRGRVQLSGVARFTITRHALHFAATAASSAGISADADSRPRVCSACRRA